MTKTIVAKPGVADMPIANAHPILPGETVEVFADDPKWHDKKFLQAIADAWKHNPQSPARFHLCDLEVLRNLKIQVPIIGKCEQFSDLYISPMDSTK